MTGSDAIDNLLKIFGNHAAGTLRLEAGNPPRIVGQAGDARDLSGRALSRQEILAVIGPIVPDNARRPAPNENSVRFDYACPDVGTFNVVIVRDTEHLIVTILSHSPVTGAPVSAPAGLASAPAPPAPAVAASGANESAPAAPAPVAPEPALDDPAARPPTWAPTPAPQSAADAPEPAAPAANVHVSPAAPEPAPVASQPVLNAARAVAAQAPVPRPAAPVSAAPPAIDQLFRAMSAAGASDLHLTVGMPPLIRKDGHMQPLAEAAPLLDPESMVALLRPIIPERNQTEFDERHDTDFAYEIPGLARFRANIFMDRKGSGAVFRVIPTNILTAEQLGLSSYILQLCRLTKGLVLVTGPTGSGKSTTLCAMVDHINRTRNDHIITIEDPIEFVHESKKCLINQREVRTHTDSFKDALRAALREDPDIVLVGEMRDLETVAIAIETAETGHLVFGTLHTTTAASTVDRIIDQFPTDRQSQIRVMLSESLRGVISQTLCRKIGGGRVAALEVLIVTPAVSNLIREAKTFQIPSIMQVGKALGMVGLNDALMDLVTKKQVAPEEAYVKSVDKASFEGLLKRAGIDTKFVQATAT